MVIYKFGGASVKDADSVINASKIISSCNEQLIIVVSAMAKTTNKLERIVEAYLKNEPSAIQLTIELKNWHLEIVNQLFHNSEKSIYKTIDIFFEGLLNYLKKENIQKEYDFEYDQIVPYGELLSSNILSAYLHKIGYPHEIIDARSLIFTDNIHREANVDWEKCLLSVNAAIQSFSGKNILTQGFIGSSAEEHSMTTLGREGSDYTAAILAFCSDASVMTIWKDVPGVFNADPHEFPEAVPIPELSYYDAIEQAYYGATIIHPKTIKPLQNKNIPLWVKSFYNTEAKGTLITGNNYVETIPSIIIKKNQTLLSLSPLDFSFIAEDHLRDIFDLLYQFRIKVNLMQNSALNFTICMNADPMAFEQICRRMENRFRIRYNSSCVLMTIRHFQEAFIAKYSQGKELLLEQRSRTTVQFVYKNQE